MIRPSLTRSVAIFTAAARGPLRAPRLEHVELAALDRELEVLDVAVVLLELLADAQELVVDRGHVGLHLADLRRRPDAGHDILALGVGQVLAEEHLLAGVRVAREGDAGPRVVAHVAEDHGHDVDRGAQVVGDLLVVAVVDGALAEPAGEDGLDREVELLVAGRSGSRGRCRRGRSSLNSVVSARRSSAVRSVSCSTPRACLAASSAWSKRSPFTSMTIRPNIWMNRR